MIIQTAAALVSFTGMYGVLKKRAWGPALCGIASGGWAVIAFSTGQHPWGLVEVAYFVANLAIALKWRQE